MTEVEAVVFDLDGVLVDSEHLWDEVREELARERNGRWHDRAQADMMGMSSRPSGRATCTRSSALHRSLGEQASWAPTR